MKNAFICLLLFTFAACGNDTVTGGAESEASFTPAQIAAQSDAYERMMDVHNRVMPRMGQLGMLQKQLHDELELGDMQEDVRNNFQAAFDALETANDNMMEWMRNVKSMNELREMDDHEAILAYIRDEEQKMAVLETRMESGMRAASELLVTEE